MASAKEVTLATQVIQDHVLRPYEDVFTTEAWRDSPEVPSATEIMPKDDDAATKDFFEKWSEYQQDPVYDPGLPHNVVNGPWPSKEEYIAAHYRILREDAIASLRSSIKSFKRDPEMFDDKFTHVYTHIYFKGLMLAVSGPAFRIEFSHERAQKQIRWEHSNRLQQGTMVALSPVSDNFRSICKVAIVAARPIEGLNQNPPRIDIFWGDYNDATFDPVEPYVMLEARQGYYEASRHMLVALQKLRTEQFGLSRHLAELDPNIDTPAWLEEQRFLDLSSLFHPEIDPETGKLTKIPANEELDIINADVLQGFPNIPYSGMDESQMKACESMVTKKISIVQGPPGTGKTFTSVSALRVMIENMTPKSPPIIIAAQTNHALDQLMNHIMAFESNVLRLGGRSDKENVEILKRTLYMLRQTHQEIPNAYKGIKTVKAMLESRSQEIQKTMAPLLTANFLCDETLLREGIITEFQKESLYDEEAGWANGNQSDNFGGPKFTAIGTWVGADNLIPIPSAPLVNLGLPLEESDMEWEQLKEIEAENEEALGEKGRDDLRGIWVEFNCKWTGRAATGVNDRQVKKQLSIHKNLYDIPMGMRGQIYRYWEKQLKKKMLAQLKDHLREYKSTVDDFRVTKWVRDYTTIRHLGIKVIGCTTTGLSKYRGLLAALQPHTLLIEEAAETLEGTVMAGMFESLQQLILVGDHQQLQANATLRALEAQPYNLSISMFERLVSNAIGYTMLNKQRRMITDIRQLLCLEPAPFYSNLQDHTSVLDRRVNRQPVPGMGGKDTYFFHHNWPESRTSDQSRYNLDEAEMIAGFYNHLVMNGTTYSKITVLAFYNGQRKAILKELKRHPSIGKNIYFNVFTVDSYQGEENDVILLSLVRSNDFLNIGFLENKNRLVVALSRARRGLYIFGNATTLTGRETSVENDDGILRDPMWHTLLRHLRDTARFDLEGGLPITCSNHGKTIRIHDASQFIGLAGGCDQKCVATLECGHLCPHPCHPFDHSRVFCAVACAKVLKCGHGCSNNCGEECFCTAPDCAITKEKNNLGDQTEFDMAVVGEAIWGSPSKMGKQQHSLTFRPHGATLPVSPKTSMFGNQDICKDISPKKGMFVNQDFRKDNRRDSSGLRSRCITSGGYGMTKYGVLGGEENFNSPARRSPADHAGMESWRTWNAMAADKEAMEQRKRIEASSPQVDSSSLVIKETYRAVKIENGVRVKDPSSSTNRVVQGADPSPSASQSKPTTSNPPIKSATMASQNLQKAMPENDPFILPNLSSKPIPEGYLKSTPRPPSKPVTTGPSKPTDYFGRPHTAKSTAASSSTGPVKAANYSKTAAPAKATATSMTKASSQSSLPSKKTVALTNVSPARIAAPFKPTPSSKATAPHEIASPKPSDTRIADWTPLLDLEDSVVPEDRLNSSITDLIGLQVGNPENTFGTVDFNEFEKLFL